MYESRVNPEICLNPEICSVHREFYILLSDMILHHTVMKGVKYYLGDPLNT